MNIEKATHDPRLPEWTKAAMQGLSANVRYNGDGSEIIARRSVVLALATLAALDAVQPPATAGHAPTPEEPPAARDKVQEAREFLANMEKAGVMTPAETDEQFVMRWARQEGVPPRNIISHGNAWNAVSRDLSVAYADSLTKLATALREKGG